MKAVFLDRSTISESVNFEPLELAVDELTCYPLTRREQILPRAQFADIIITNKVEFDAELLSCLPQLRLICITATGINNVDLVAAKQNRVAVANVSGYSTASVAQHVFAYLLNVSNNVTFYQKLAQTKPWHQSPIFCQLDAPINELAGKKLGIFGYGTLGKAVAKIALSFGLSLLIAERPGQEKLRQGRVAFADMLTNADVISVHCPLTDDTAGLFGEKTFKLMKPGCIFINTARGPVVDSRALAENLSSGHIAHAIIDVLEQEPPQKEHPLLATDIPNLTITPHIAWGSIQAQQRLMDGVTENILSYCRGERLNRVD